MVKMVHFISCIFYHTKFLIIEEANMEKEELNVKDKTLKKKKSRGKYLAPSSRSKLTTIIMSPTKGQPHSF